jgi:excisionase family DNA binding protein
VLRLNEDQNMELLKPKDVAQQLSVAPITIYKWCERGVLPHFRLQGCIRFTQDDVDAFVRERRVRAKKRGTPGDSQSLEGSKVLQ